MSEQRLILVELNEFNNQLLHDACKAYKLNNLKKIFSLKCCETFTHDTYESDFLEPWVQWVSVHTGVESHKHKIKHLGDVTALEQPQIWEVLADNGVTTGVWGCLNGAKGNQNKSNLFFLPDPWTVAEKAFPNYLNSLIDLPRYIVTHRAKFSLLKATRSVMKFFLITIDPRIFFAIIKELPTAIKMHIKYQGAEFAGFCLLEYISGILFLKYKRKYNPKFSVIFLNSLAHLQHYYWKNPLQSNEQMRYGLKLLDKLYGKILGTIKPTDGIAVANALSQISTCNEPAWVSYCPHDPAKFLKDAGIIFSRVEPLMSYDALVFFDNTEACDNAYNILLGAKINNEQLFLAERYKNESCKLFYRFKFTGLTDQESEFTINGKKFNFKKYFKKIVIRTGKHV